MAALPVLFDGEGRIRVMLVTSRETQRFIVPKGWPMKGRKDHRAAAIEAKQEAGVVGRIHRKPIGSYTYWKRRDRHFDRCDVSIYVLEVEQQLADWPATSRLAPGGRRDRARRRPRPGDVAARFAERPRT